MKIEEGNPKSIIPELDGSDLFNTAQSRNGGSWIYYEVGTTGDKIIRQNVERGPEIGFFAADMGHIEGYLGESCPGELFSRMNAEQKEEFLKIFPNLLHYNFRKRRN